MPLQTFDVGPGDYSKGTGSVKARGRELDKYGRDGAWTRNQISDFNYEHKGSYRARLEGDGYTFYNNDNVKVAKSRLPRV